MKFQEIALCFEAIQKISSRLEITQLLAALFKEASAHEVQIISYMTMGTLRPSYQGTQFNIAEKSMKKVVAQVLQVSTAVIDNHLKELGDLGSVFFKYHKNVQNGYDYSVSDMYQVLIDFEKIEGTGSQELREVALVELLSKLDALSGCYVIRILLGKLRLGFSDMTIVDAFSWMLVGDKKIRGAIEDAYNKCADLGLIGKVLKEHGQAGLEHIDITVGIPIRPAAAERLPTAREIVEKIGHCIAQPKLDGFRVQIHVDKKGPEPKIRFFSRNLQNMSDMFPELVKALEAAPVKTLIAEGEAIAFDEETGSFMPFQETVKRKRKHDITEVAAELPLKLFLFDAMYCNGESLLDKTESQRRDKLLEIFPHSTGTIQVISERAISTASELEDYFAENIEAGLEGVVVKKKGAHYQPGKRNFNWIKLKREEKSHLEDTIDAVVLGYYYGKGKRSKFGIGAFLVGIYNTHDDNFETVAKVGTGLKDADWIDLKKRCDALHTAHKPNNVVCASSLAPNVWVYPEIVCVIRADEITHSPVHTAGKTNKLLGYGLRFPRFMGYSVDKKATQATTVRELLTLIKHQTHIRE